MLYVKYFMLMLMPSLMLTSVLVEHSLWELFKYYVAEFFCTWGTIKSATGNLEVATVMVVAVMVVVDMEVAKLIQGRKARVDIKELMMVDGHVMVMVVKQR